MLLQNLPPFMFIYLCRSRFIYRTFCHQSEKSSKLITKSSISQTESIINKQKSTARTKRNDYLYIKEATDGERIASHLCCKWRGHILEANPGPGILTQSILNNGGDISLRVFEKNDEFLPVLNDLSLQHSNLDIIPEDIILLPSIEARLSTNESTAFDSFFSDIPEQSWEDGISFRFFSVISGQRCIKFLRYLIAVLPNRGTIFSFGRCELFLIVPESEYLYMFAEPKLNFATYRWVTVLYHIFFDIDCLEKFPIETFRPVSYRKKGMKGGKFYLMKLTPRTDLFSSVVNGNRLTDFYFFVRHHLIKRTGLVIPTLESWIPSCGPRLIKEGMHVFTKFGDLSPKQILELFNQFSSWPEYQDSSFTAALQRYYGKHVSHDEESHL